MRTAAALCLATCLASSTAPAGERPGAPKTAAQVKKELVTLTVEETAGAERSGVAVTSGLPLPQGACKDVSALALVVGGKPVPAQFNPVMKWPDGSLRWALASFVLEKAPAGGKVPVTLALAAGGGTASGAPLAADAGDRLVVDTGVLKFTVRKKNFNLIDEAWLDPSGAGNYGEAAQVIKSHEGGGPEIKVGDKVYAASADADCKVEIEENGPVCCVLKATGAHKNGADKTFDYMVRIYAYAGRPSVRVVYAWINRQGKRPDCIKPADISLVLPTALAGKLGAQLGGDKAPHAFALEPGQSGWSHQTCKESCELGGAAGAGGGGGLKEQVFTTGWGAIDDGKLGLAAGRRWFWQMHPAEVELAAAPEGGRIVLRFWTGRSGQTVDCYTGTARTHYVLLDFFKAEARAAAAASMLDLNRPLYALAPPAWYCQDTFALGKIASAEKSLYDEETWKAVEHHDQQFAKQINWILARRTAHRGKHESYGYRYFGDFVHYPEMKPGIKWDGNYYDFPHAAFQHFLRTGNRKYFDIFEDTYTQVQDIHMVHYDPNPKMVGSSRYCPSNDQVVMEGKSVYVSDTFNHWKNQSLVDAYLMTGEKWAWEVAWLGFEHLLSYKGADGAYNQPRGPGVIMLSAAYGHMLTGDRKFLDRIQDVAAHGIKRVGGGGMFNGSDGASFQLGITMEGFMTGYLATGDEKLAETLRKHADAQLAKYWQGGKYGGKLAHQSMNSAAAFAFLYRKYGQAQYAEAARNLMASVKGFDKLKDTGLVYRSTAYACYWLSKLAENEFKRQGSAE